MGNNFRRNKLNETCSIFNDDTLYEILSFHDDFEFLFLHCALVSKQWYKIISERLTRYSANCYSKPKGKHLSKIASLKLIKKPNDKIRMNFKILEQMKELTHLKLGKDYIDQKTVEILQKITPLQQLTEISISHNFIGCRGLEILSQLPNIRKIHADNSYLSCRGLKYLTNMKELTFLDAPANSVLSYEYLDQLVNLKYLNIANNRLNGSLCKNVAKLKKLTYLDIGLNRIENEGLKIICEMTNLNYLNVSSNNINDEGVVHLCKLPNLVSLNIGLNFIRNIYINGASFIWPMKDLTSLNISNQNVGLRGIETICELKQLKTLTLNNSNVNCEGAKLISEELNQLTALEIRYNIIGLEGEKFIGQMKNLRHLVMGED